MKLIPDRFRQYVEYIPPSQAQDTIFNELAPTNVGKPIRVRSAWILKDVVAVVMPNHKVVPLVVLNEKGVTWAGCLGNQVQIVQHGKPKIIAIIDDTAEGESDIPLALYALSPEMRTDDTADDDEELASIPDHTDDTADVDEEPSFLTEQSLLDEERAELEAMRKTIKTPSKETRRALQTQTAQESPRRMSPLQAVEDQSRTKE